MYIMYVAILGRQPALGIAELEMIYGAQYLDVVSRQAVLINTDNFNLDRLGGTPKAGKVIDQMQTTDWRNVSQKITQLYCEKWSHAEAKITLGISTYGFSITPQEVQKTGLVIKQKLKKSGVSLRLIPNQEPSISTATSHHNKLGLSDNKVELLVVRGGGHVIIAESVGAQNITAYARRDQNRPKRDAFVGMLPPKLAQIMINLGTYGVVKDATILDPFCGTGVILQEAALMGYGLYGTDLSEKMIRYSRENLEWIFNMKNVHPSLRLNEGDATIIKWQPPIDAIVCETYLGQPFSAPPSTSKLESVKTICNHIISEFLKNIHGQIKSGTALCIAVPAWRSQNGDFTHLPLVETVARLGYKPHELRHVSKNDLLYYRENQIVARELLILTRI